ncbi:MAG: ArsR family transcriptional regulator, partial [Candidatus Sericytochromatia bacterium]|nr:ArsR family transcriptional regulator [Candidatus Tanganyikabacteria bacterium]
AFGEPIRLKILQALAGKERSVSDLAGVIGQSVARAASDDNAASDGDAVGGGRWQPDQSRRISRVMPPASVRAAALESFALTAPIGLRWPSASTRPPDRRPALS